LIAQVLIDNFATRENRLPGWQKNLQERADSMWVEPPLADKIVGFAMWDTARVADEGCYGQLYAIYLLEEAQRQGIGRALVERTRGDMRAAGFRSVRVEMMSNNLRAKSFYEKLGSTFARNAPFEMMGHKLTESVYVWRSLSL
jgi:ribosomal protein S18 acetylase RimI-like enzyme